MAAEDMVDDLRHAYETWAQGDPQPALALMADEISWTVPGEHALSGTYTGSEEIMGLWRRLPEHLRGLEVHDLFAKGDTILVTNTITLDVGSAFSIDFWRFRDGKAVEFRGVTDTSLFERAFGSS